MTFIGNQISTIMFNHAATNKLGHLPNVRVRDGWFSKEYKLISALLFQLLSADAILNLAMSNFTSISLLINIDCKLLQLDICIQINVQVYELI